MINRIVALFGAVLMVCASPFSSAWDAQSFVADSPDYYTMFPSGFSSSNSVLADSSDTVSDPDLTIDDLFDNGTWLCDGMAFWVHCYNPGYDSGIPEIPDIDPYEYDVVNPLDGLSWTFLGAGSNNKYWNTSLYSIPDSWNGADIESVFVPGFVNASNDPSEVQHYTCDFQFDISSLGSFTTFEIAGYFYLIPQLKYNGSIVSSGTINSVELIVDGDSLYQWVLESASPSFTIPYTLVDRTSPITSVALRITFNPSSSVSYQSGNYQMTLYSWHYTGDSYSQNLSMSVVGSDAVLDSYNDQAQSDIDSHEEVEGEWVQTSSDNFAALDIENFSIPSSLLSGFALISGIFTDIWNALGDYRVIFVLPLTLGVILVVVGRIARTAGSQSSRNKGGDGNA